MGKHWAAVVLLASGVAGGTASAFEPVGGEFVASQTCPATVSTKRAQIDGTEVQAGSTYKALGYNRPGGDFIQVMVPGARPEQRWVRVECGALGGIAAAPPPSARGMSSSPAVSGSAPKYLLAISWQPAFCELQRSATECLTVTVGRFDADHFSLHGLWPQPESNAYCGVPARDRAVDQRHGWDLLPEPPIAKDTRFKLNVAMPGTASNLHRHEWIKHGVCYGADANTYYRTALALLDQVNSSKLREFMSGRIGNTVTVGQLKSEFEKSFGAGTGAALAVRCNKGGGDAMVGEIWINLKGTLSDTTPLKSVLDTSAPARSNCNKALVDRVGLN